MSRLYGKAPLLSWMKWSVSNGRGGRGVAKQRAKYAKAIC